jgi:hypothetical protein
MQLTELTRPQSCVHVSTYTECSDIRLMLGGLWAKQLAVNLEQAHATAEKELQHLKHALPCCARHAANTAHDDLVQTTELPLLAPAVLPVHGWLVGCCVCEYA